MKITYYLLISASIIGLFSCSDAEKTTTESEASGTTTTTVSAEGSATENLNEPLPSMPAAANQATASASGLNPAHGEAGHRCDIAVGAPLNSAPTQNTTALPQTSSGQSPKPAVMTMPTVTPPPAQTGTGSGKINPAHGEPGHVCGKPVGQPL